MPKTIEPAARQRVYRAAVYARLSVDDRNIGTSYSITNQVELIKDYLSEHSGFECVGAYIDDGVSGSSFNRPDWIRLIDDIARGSVDCIVVKDLSRLGRNYLELSRLLERELPAKGVRVIAITDGYDSIREKTSADAITLPVKNLFNDMYCRDSSAKTKASLSAKRRRGEFTGSFAPYGYVRGMGSERSKLVVDPEAAAVVRDVFDWRLMGLTPASIAERLNGASVPCPYEHSRRNGRRHSGYFVGEKPPSWDARMIIRILSNEAYIGNLVQGKTYKPDFRSAVILHRDADEWCRAEATHEAIVDVSTFELAQQVGSRDMRRAPGHDTLLPFSGYVLCARCGATLARRTVRNKKFVRHYYSCETHRKDRHACSMHKIGEGELEERVAAAIQLCIASALNESKASEKSIDHRRDRHADLVRRAGSADDAIGRAKELRLRMYADFADGVIGRDEYQGLAQGMDRRLAALQAERADIAREMVRTGQASSASWLDLLASHEGEDKVSRITVVELVDRILVHEGGDVEVVFRFGDPFLTRAQEGQPCLK